MSQSLTDDSAANRPLSAISARLHAGVLDAELVAVIADRLVRESVLWKRADRLRVGDADAERLARELWPRADSAAIDGLAAVLNALADVDELLDEEDRDGLRLVVGLNGARERPERELLAVAELTPGASDWPDDPSPVPAGSRIRAPRDRQIERGADVTARLLAGQCTQPACSVEFGDGAGLSRGARIHCAAHAGLRDRAEDIRTARRLLEAVAAAHMRADEGARGAGRRDVPPACPLTADAPEPSRPRDERPQVCRAFR